MSNAIVVSKALRRDVGIITQPFPKIGYSVHRSAGVDSAVASIWVSVSDAEGTNKREAARLAEELADVYGWKVFVINSIIYVKSVPNKAEAAASLERYEELQNLDAQVELQPGDMVVERARSGRLGKVVEVRQDTAFPVYVQYNDAPNRTIQIHSRDEVVFHFRPVVAVSA